jgi:YHS domain-containing protein
VEFATALFFFKRRPNKVKLNLAVLILSVLAANVAMAATSRTKSDPSNSSLSSLAGHSPVSTQVWLEQSQQRLNVDSNGVILKGYDVVAYFSQHKAIQGSPKYKTSHGGATYYFSSAANLAAFKANPSKYAPEFGGYCANSVRSKKLVDSDPTAFFVTNGKLYVCSSHADVEQFRSHEKENLRKAYENWSGAWWIHGNGS